MINQNTKTCPTTLKARIYKNYKLLKTFLNCSCKHMQIKDECVTLKFFAKKTTKDPF
jgi:hypothetical protein